MKLRSKVGDKFEAGSYGREESGEAKVGERKQEKWSGEGKLKEGKWVSERTEAGWLVREEGK